MQHDEQSPSSVRKRSQTERCEEEVTQCEQQQSSLKTKMERKEQGETDLDNQSKRGEQTRTRGRTTAIAR